MPILLAKRLLPLKLKHFNTSALTQTSEENRLWLEKMQFNGARANVVIIYNSKYAELAGEYEKECQTYNKYLTSSK